MRLAERGAFRYNEPRFRRTPRHCGVFPHPPVVSRETRLVHLWAALLMIYPQTAGGDYVNQALGFRFTPPAGWKSVQPPQAGRGFVVAYVENVTVTAANPGLTSESDAEYLKRIREQLKQPPGTGRTSKASLTVMATRIPQATLHEYARETRSVEQRLGGSEYRVIGERNLDLAGVPAFERTVRVGARGSSAFMLREVACLREGRLISISLTSPYGRYKALFTRFRRMLDTFQWLR